MKPADMRKGDRVRVGGNTGTLLARQNKTGGMGLDVQFDGGGIPCICDPEDVVFVERPAKKKSKRQRELESLRKVRDAAAEMRSWYRKQMGTDGPEVAFDEALEEARKAST